MGAFPLQLCALRVVPVGVSVSGWLSLGRVCAWACESVCACVRPPSMHVCVCVRVCLCSAREGAVIVCVAVVCKCEAV